MDICVITEPCVGTCDTACVSACPVDCIHGPLPLDEIRAIPAEERGVKLPGVQMYIDPEECIACGACIPQCPVQAIYARDEVPEKWQAAIELNARFFAERKGA